jgi:hypothetical protein
MEHSHHSSAYQALNIALQHSLLPSADIGGKIDVCEHQIHHLREKIQAHQSKCFEEAKSLDVVLPPEKDIISLYTHIEADEIEKTSGTYFALMTSLLQRTRPSSTTNTEEVTRL